MVRMTDASSNRVVLDRCMTCGHDKRCHIYYEGACRPGFVCSFGCEKFVPMPHAIPSSIPTYICDICGADMGQLESGVKAHKAHHRFTREHPLGTYDDACRADHAEMYPEQQAQEIPNSTAKTCICEAVEGLAGWFTDPECAIHGRAIPSHVYDERIFDDEVCRASNSHCGRPGCCEGSAGATRNRIAKAILAIEQERERIQYIGILNSNGINYIAALDFALKVLRD
jgi:hypothetical protein